MKFCKDCKHSEKHDSNLLGEEFKVEFSRCRREVREETSLVTGTTKSILSNHYCSTERWSGECGKEGIFWEASNETM